MADYDGYIKSLEKILDGVTKDYWASYVDINRHQVNVGRAYLWVSAALFGIYLTASTHYLEKITESKIVLVLVFISFLSVIVAFGTSLYAIPARKGYKTIPRKGWGEFSHEAYQLLKNGSNQVYASFLSSFIGRIDHAFVHNVNTNRRRAKLLRHTSTLLLVSFIAAFLAITTVVIFELNSYERETKAMTDENSQEQSQAAPEPQETAQLDVPEPPETADLGGDDYITHSASPGESTTIFTESKKEK